MTTHDIDVSGFVSTPFTSAEDKAKFVKHFVRFVESGCKPTLFYDWFYKGLSGHLWGHIAEYNRQGFYATWFATDAQRLKFFQRALGYRQSRIHGDPAHTWSDVEHALTSWIIRRGLHAQYRAKVGAEVEAAERAELARLKAKYEGAI